MSTKILSQNRDFFISIQPNCSSCVYGIDADRKALHEEIEIKCFYSGAATLMIGDEVIHVQAGDIVVINPYEFHTTIKSGDAGSKGLYHLFMIPLDVFTAKEADDLNLQTLLLGSGNAFQPLYQDDKTLFRILMSMVREYEEKEVAYELAVGGLLRELFAHLIRSGLSAAGKEKDHFRLYRLIEPALREIRDHFQEPISVEHLSELCSLSKSYFCRVFKRVTDKTPMEYLGDYRLKTADAMLRNSDRTIASIAEACGFESFSYFCRSYKKQYGVPPSARR